MDAVGEFDCGVGNPGFPFTGSPILPKLRLGDRMAVFRVVRRLTITSSKIIHPHRKSLSPNGGAGNQP
jgi:hypothetical protein